MPALFKSANACNLLRRNLLLDTWLASREIIEQQWSGVGCPGM